MSAFIKKGRALIAFAAVAALAFTGCSSSEGNKGNKATDNPTSTTSGGEKVPSKILNMYNGASGAFTENYNPFSPSVMSMIQGSVYEPLFYYNQLGKLSDAPKPMLGTEFKWNADGTQLDVTIKDGIKWNDGKPFTAKDVAYTFNLISNTPTLNTTGNKTVATAADDTHVTLKFDRPSFVDGPNILGKTYIVPEHIWTAIKDPDVNINKGPVGTGPFMFDSFTPQAYVLKRNPNYWQAGLPKIGGIRLISLSGNQASVDNLLAGKLDYTSTFIPNIDKVLSANKALSFTNTGNSQVVLGACANAELGCTGPQTDPAVRKAIYYAMDRPQLNKLAFSDLGGKSSPAYALLNRDEAFIDQSLQGSVPWEPDVKKSDELLTAAGWAKGADGFYAKGGQKLSLTVTMVTGWTDYITTVDTLKQQLKPAGIDIIAKQVAYNEFTNACGNGKYQLVMTSLGQGPAPDPYYVYDTYFNGKRTGKVGDSVNPYQNISRYSNPQVDAALAAAAGTTDVEKKTQEYFKIQKLVFENMPYIPVILASGLTEYNTTNFEGFPTQDNLYAYPLSWSSPDNAQVLLKLTEK